LIIALRKRTKRTVASVVATREQSAEIKDRAAGAIVPRREARPNGVTTIVKRVKYKAPSKNPNMMREQVLRMLRVSLISAGNVTKIQVSIQWFSCPFLPIQSQNVEKMNTYQTIL
jgi:lactam utilization protein B